MRGHCITASLLASDPDGLADNTSDDREGVATTEQLITEPSCGAGWIDLVEREQSPPGESPSRLQLDVGGSGEGRVYERRVHAAEPQLGAKPPRAVASMPSLHPETGEGGVVHLAVRFEVGDGSGRDLRGRPASTQAREQLLAAPRFAREEISGDGPGRGRTQNTRRVGPQDLRKGLSPVLRGGGAMGAVLLVRPGTVSLDVRETS
jgi:hypothetical protein